MKLLKTLYRIYSPSKKEGKMIRFLVNCCKNIPDTKVKVDDIGNIYVTRGKSDSYPCLVAHTDQVQRLHPKDFVAIETRDIIIGYSPSTRQQCGLGADDKNGIWIALKCLEKYPVMKAAFFMGEEIGCLGSEKADMAFFEDTRFVIQCDRRGHNDLITEICSTELCSKEFLEAVNFKDYSSQPGHGLTTDVLTLKEKGLAVCCVNMSCGYYEPHTDNEFTVKKDLINALRFTEHIIESCQGSYPHQPAERYGYGYGYGTIYDMEFDELYNELWGILESNPDCSSKSVVRCYKEFYPHLKEADVEMAFHMVKTDLGDTPRKSSAKSDQTTRRRDYQSGIKTTMIAPPS